MNITIVIVIHIILILVLFLPLFIDVVIPIIRTQWHIKKAIKDKAIPKPIECLSTGDTLYIFKTSILKNMLTNLTEKNITEDIFKKVFDTYIYVYRITSSTENAKHIMHFDIKSMFGDSVNFNYFKISHDEDKKKYVVEVGGSYLISSSLKLLSVYVQKMIQDSKNAALEKLNKKAEAYNADDVYHWLEEIKGQSLSVVK